MLWICSHAGLKVSNKFGWSELVFNWTEISEQLFNRSLWDSSERLNSHMLNPVDCGESLDFSCSTNITSHFVFGQHIFHFINNTWKLRTRQPQLNQLFWDTKYGNYVFYFKLPSHSFDKIRTLISLYCKMLGHYFAKMCNYLKI